MSVKKIVGALALLALAVTGEVVYFRIQSGKKAVALKEASERKPVGKIEFESPDGSHFPLRRYRGMPVIIDVWASWCGPCLENVPNLVKLKQQHQGQLEILGVNVDSYGWPELKGFRQRFPDLNYPLVRVYPEPFIIQSLVSIEPLGQVSVLPSAFLIDSKGRLAGKYVGLEQMDQLREDVGALLGS